MDLLNKNINHDYLCDIIIIAMSKTAIGSTAIGHKYTTIWRRKKKFFTLLIKLFMFLQTTQNLRLFKTFNQPDRKTKNQQVRGI